MNVILKEDVEKLGFKNEVVSVKNGYGRNFLIPKGLAILATKSEIKILEENLRQQDKKQETEIAKANKLADKITGLEIIIKAKVAEGNNKLFGSIKTKQFMDTVAELGCKLDSKFIKIPIIKELGKYEAEIRLHRKVSTTVSFTVISE